MADPFSIAGSAVGVISLGLQVCSMLVSYCNSVQGADQDLRSIANKAAGLRVPLKTLRDILEEQEIAESETHPWSTGLAAQPDIRNDIKDKVQLIVAAIERLKNAVDKYGPAASHGGLDDKVRAGYKKLLYPFRKETLRDILTELDEIQMNLHMSLHVYSMRNISLIPYIIDLQRSMHQEIQHMPTLTAIEILRTETVHMHEEYHGEQSSITRSGTSQIQFYQEPLVSEQNVVCTNLDTQMRRRMANKYCSHTTTKRYNYSRRILGLFISAFFSFTSGAGGMSIAPTLRFQALIPDGSLIFGHYNGHQLAYLFNEDSAVDMLISRLQQLFSERKISPADIFPSGESLLYRVCDTGVYDDSWARVSRVAEFLVNAGTPVNTATSDGTTALDCLVDSMFKWANFSETHDHLIRYLMDRGGYISRIPGPLSRPQKRILKRLLRSEYEDGVLFPNIAKIILQESEELLRAALNSGTADANDTVQSMTLLELSIGWPKGVQILLKAGADIHLRDYHINQAIRQQCHESLVLLLEAGSRIRLEDIEHASSSFFSYFRYGISTSTSTSMSIRSTLITTFAWRRRRLAELARYHVPPNDLPSSLKDKYVVPDTASMSLYNALIAKNVSVDPTLEVEYPGLSIYHGFWDTSLNSWSLLSLETMKEMYKAGFHDIDVHDPSGRTPLMMAEGYAPWTLETARWLVAKGASLFRMLPESHATVFHLLACVIADSANSDNYMRLNRFADYIIQAPIQDNCLCGCCSDGCTPLLIALRFAIQQWSSLDPGWVNIFCRSIISLAPATTEFSRMIIRFLTFDGLGLTHTCCHLIYEDGVLVIKDREESEVNEIRDEEKSDLERFEILLTELNTKFDELGLPLVDFLQEYWHPRILEFLTQRDPYDEEHDNEARKLGVHLELEENCIPDRVSLKLCSKVWEITE